MVCTRYFVEQQNQNLHVRNGYEIIFNFLEEKLPYANIVLVSTSIIIYQGLER